ncbi:MAG: DUF751 family protein [Synechococcales cyanobacterium RU_4_20]|nr:DUF751 family protein [Synechococcales cyanobacterium RU_4_20]
MKDFFVNVSRYPRYFITFLLGIFYSLYQWLRPMIKTRTTAIALGGVVVTGFLFITFTLRAMLGVAETGLTPPPVDMF